MICDVKAMENVVMEMKYDAQKAPLGLLVATLWFYCICIAKYVVLNMKIICCGFDIVCDLTI